MAERYTRLFGLTENLYQNGSPILIAAGALLKDNQTGKALAQIKLQSLSDKPIKAAKVSITPLDVVGNELGERIEHQYLDLNIQRDEDFGTKSPVYLPDATARGFTAEVRSVVFADNTVWTASDAAWEPIPTAVPLDEVYPDAELHKQFKLEFGPQSQYAYSEFADLCHCPCGALNWQSEGVCHACGCDLLALRALDTAELESRKNERLEQERIAEEERQEQARIAEEQRRENAAIAAKRAKKIAAIVVPIVCVVIAFLIVLNSVIIPYNKYNDAVALLEAGQYEEAIAAFEDMDGYKDSEYKIAECEEGIETAALDAQYDEAMALMGSGEYEEAINAFEALDGYKDSTEKLVECEVAELKTSEIGDYVYFGSYEQDNVKSNSKEKILWRVLDIQDGRALLISMYALDCQPYNEERVSVTWEDCTLRTWLNSEFLNSAFSVEEQTLIPEVKIPADSSVDSGKETQERAFLLSISEAETYFVSDDARKCRPTDYADSNGADVNNRGNCWWWLRTVGRGKNCAVGIDGDGSVSSLGHVVDYCNNAVRPAIWVEIGE